MRLKNLLIAFAAFSALSARADLVIDVQGNAGRILEINNQDQTAQVRFSSGIVTKPLRELSLKVAELGRHKVGHTVFEMESRRVAKIQSLYANGVVVLEISGYPSPERTHVSKISAISPEATEVFSGKQFINRSGRTGTIRTVFENGHAWVQYEKHSQSEEMTSIAVSVPQIGKIGVGDRVIDKLTGAQGSVATLFKNGMGRIFFDGSHDGKLVSISTVRLPEITCTSGLL